MSELDTAEQRDERVIELVVVAKVVDKPPRWRIILDERRAVYLCLGIVVGEEVGRGRSCETE